jgi:hypothetical protein
MTWLAFIINKKKNKKEKWLRLVVGGFDYFINIYASRTNGGIAASS